MLRLNVGSPLVSLFIAFSLFLTGCGDQPKAADAPTPADKKAEAANNGSSQATDADPKSDAAAAASAAPPAAPAVLEDVRQFAAVLDLGKLPMPSGGTLSEASPTRFHANVQLKVRPAVDFYLKKLDAEGWKPVGPNPMEGVSDSFAQLQLGKGNYLLSMVVLPGDGKLAGVEIEQHGDLDSRTLPRLDKAEDQFSDHGSSLYFTSVKFDKAVEELRNRLKADGWQEYDKAFSQKADRHDAADLLFRKKAYSLRVAVSIPATDPGKTAVQYGISTLARDMPAPADAGHVEIEDSQWKLMCDTPSDMAATADFYRAAMKKIGFPEAPKENASDDWRSLSFESPDKDIVLVMLQENKEKDNNGKDSKAKGTKIKIEGYTAAFQEAVKKAGDAARARHAAQEKAAAADKAERAKASKEKSDQEDKMIEGAIGNAVKSATQSLPPGDHKKIEDDMQEKLKKAFQDSGLQPVPKPDAKPEK